MIRKALYSFIDSFIERFKKSLDTYNIKPICKEYGIKNYSINRDGSIDVRGSVYLSNKGFTKLPLKFGKVTGHFYCSGNKLTTLEGCPKEVGGDFDCRNNLLTTLEGSPIEVVGGFYCSYNQLKNLEGSPKSVVGSFYCNDNKLTTLEGSPMLVGEDFNCYNNELFVFNNLLDYFYCFGNPISAIWNLFYNTDFLYKVKYVYTDHMSLIKFKEGQYYIESDILEEIAEELGKELPEDWRERVIKVGYRVI